MENADLTLVIFDRSQPLDENDDLICREAYDKSTLVIINKCDLPENWSIDNLEKKIKIGCPILISVKEQSGLDVLIDTIYNHIIDTATSNETVFISRERHRSHLVEASASLEKTLESLELQLSEEFVAIDLGIAMSHLATILGKSMEEELLDQIFNSFCIGK